jgi:nickel-dependent lactate racemase
VIVKLPYGRETVAVDLRGMRVRPLAPTAPPGSREVGAMVGRELDRPVDGPPLHELARARGSATVIVPDATRKVELPEVLPAVLTRLRTAGVAETSTTVLVACGTHPAVGAEALRELVGPLPPGVKLVEHDSRDREGLVEVGELRPGVPLRLNRAAVETDLLITVGTVRHHYFAGFGGGPKMVFPGVAGYEEIQTNHALVFGRTADGRRFRRAECEPGHLRGNPVAEEIARAADARPPDMALSLVEGRGGGTAWAAAGPWRPAFESAVERARSWFEVSRTEPFDAMVASGGGSPSDSTLIQAHKGLDAACRFLAPGGRLLYVAAVDQGAGSDAMLPFLENPDPDRILEDLDGRWVQYGHTTLRMLEKTARHRVALHSRLDPDLARRLGFEPATDVEGVVASWRRELAGSTVGVMAGSAVYPRS